MNRVATAVEKGLDIEAMKSSIAIAKGPPPTPMVLACPRCQRQHVDRPGKVACLLVHTCEYCEATWKPSDKPTIGVETLTRHLLESMVYDAAYPKRHDIVDQGAGFLDYRMRAYYEGVIGSRAGWECAPPYLRNPHPLESHRFVQQECQLGWILGWLDAEEVAQKRAWLRYGYEIEQGAA